MPRLRRMSGSEAIAALRRFGFEMVSQRGSHAKLVRITEAGERQVVTVPTHSELDTGTARALFRQAARFIPADELRPYFYAD